ncbi:MAG: cytochrome-c oxidase, cbb3-type subunit III [Rhodospirillales bacterium]|nr:cytochrome-c oxidase, cbb3-type subunit III [Rhodospirillales bacterium]
MTTSKRDIDAFTGVETTGHEWDGIKELNKPLPRWWLLTFYVTIVWAVGYWIVYPAWPTLNGYTRGLFSYSQRDVVAQEITTARSAQAHYREKLAQTPLAAIKLDPDLYRFAMAAGTVAFQNNCAACHGRGAQGFLGYPNLNDDDWLWGGTMEEIHKTISFGIRAVGKDTRASQMPRYGIDKLLPEADINDVVEYVLSLSNKSGDTKAVGRGHKTFADQCASCHGADGKGKQEQGAPNLVDPIWLYGDSRQSILESVRTGRGAMMPAWAGRLDPATLKSLAVYVHSLGGGR